MNTCPALPTMTHNIEKKLTEWRAWARFPIALIEMSDIEKDESVTNEAISAVHTSASPTKDTN
jgi:hypothetical protein